MKKLLILFVVLVLLAAVGCALPTVTPSANTSPISEQTASAATQTITPSAEVSAITPEATTAAGTDFAGKEVTLANVEDALSFLFMDGEYVGTDVQDSGGTVYVTIMYQPSSYTDDTNFAMQVGLQAAMVMEVLFSNANIDVVTFMGNTATAEDIVEINLSKETAETVDWAAVITQAQSDYNTMLMVADSYHIDASISDKLK